MPFRAEYMDCGIIVTVGAERWVVVRVISLCPSLRCRAREKGGAKILKT